MDTEHWLLRERVVEATALVDAGPHTDVDVLATLAHLRAEIAGLVSVVCEDDPEAAEACDAGCAALASIDTALLDTAATDTALTDLAPKEQGPVRAPEAA